MENIAIIGAGFTGLSAAFHLQKQQALVTIFEKEKVVGGLAAGFKKSGWNWTLESHYHHLFTNDSVAIELMEEVKQNYRILSATTSIYKNSKIFKLDSPASLLQLSLLGILEKIRVGLLLLFLKLSPIPFISPVSFFEKQTAFALLEKTMGAHAFNVLFKPLFIGKFGNYADKISAAWFWARIKKRTKNLIYPERGYQIFAEKLSDKIIASKGKIFLDTTVKKIEKKNSQWCIITENGAFLFDKVILTTPSSIIPRLLHKIPQTLPPSFLNINHLDSLNLILETKKPVLSKTYWLNINELNFPFLAIIQHTNLIDQQNYGGNHISYIGNYLPQSHEYFDFSKEKLLTIFWPYLQQINPKLLKDDIISLYKMHGVEAQPIVEIGYEKLLPPHDLGGGLYIANMDMVYPWDRGVNYAIEMGRKVAEIISDK